MGKTQRSKASRKKAAREAEVADEFMDHILEETQQQVMEGKTDSELFVIDKVGSKRKRRIASFMKDQKAKGLDKVSKHEQKKMEKLIQTGATKVAEVKKQGKKEPEYDLWGTDAPELVTETKRISKHLTKIGPKVKKKAEAAKKATVLSMHPGQSYNPQTDAHQEMLGMALAVELDREEAKKQAQAPLSTGLSAQTKELLMNEEDYESSEEEDNAEESKTLRKTSRRKKRSDRNRHRRKKFEDLKTVEKKREKKILKDINRITEINQDLEEEEEESKQKQEVMKKWKEGAEQEKLLANIKKDPIKADALVVPLSDELHGTMRQMKNKGSLIKEHMEKLITVGAAQPKLNKKSRRPKRQKYRTIQT
eukprot:CAMPEP_0117749634 /NCGR_PEP_ID=MMETSP0947-20121206/9846_1 /TAXON_ID=44440 /ORGANISM="Chattonella subsalsa, Strain CCMP2191" /LENGTH=364 /DNA_ID=CAMNT_0005567561 /DNA_START=31 /DNA_END=1125 /DNA_ORIENTATION=-